MAEENEEIIVIEESDAAGVTLEEVKEEQTTTSSKKLYIIIAAVVIVLIVIVLAFFLLHGSDEVKTDNFEVINEKLTQTKEVHVEPSQLEKMIAKANFLYTNENKDEALALYERIAQYSEAVSLYNLGVAQLKEKQYSEAITSFKGAIQKGENRCVSAINAAVCSLHLEDKNRFEYYIDLAEAYLPYEIDSPLYDYYYTLINYYKGNYFELFSSLNNPSSDEYTYRKKDLKAKVNALFNNYYEAITALETPYEDKDALTLGLLYANIGDLTLAKKYLGEAIMQSTQSVSAQLSLAYVYLKSGQIQEGAKLLQATTDMYPEEVYKKFPVNVFLKESLFDAAKAQKNYREDVIGNRFFNYQKLFYFAPYKIFNATQAINYIRKGNANIYIDDISTAKEYLKKSSHASNINQGIAQAIKKALSFHLRSANKQLLSLLKDNPKHSVLHYNLALTFAQMGNMQEAYKHFIRSYHLDANNYLSGVFSVMSAQLIQKDHKKLLAILKDNLAHEDESEQFELYRTLLFIAQDNILGANRWLDRDDEERPLYLMMNYVIGKKISKASVMEKASEKLCNQRPNDILPHLLYINGHFSQLKTKAYAKSALNYLKKQTFHFNDLYYGPFVTRYAYTQMALITGYTYKLRLQLQNKLEVTQENPVAIMKGLALASIYDKAFENAYLLYNELIDTYKIRDTQTLYLGAVASIGAGHHANAIALLELAKLKNKTFEEIRYALGLLYLESQNNHGAGIQFSKITHDGFHSQYFNFKINTDKLLYEKQLTNQVE